MKRWIVLLGIGTAFAGPSAIAKNRLTDPVRIAEIDTDLDSLRNDPRFEAALSDAKKRLGIEEEVRAN